MQRETRERKSQNKAQSEYEGAGGQEVHSGVIQHIPAAETEGGRKVQAGGMNLCWGISVLFPVAEN